MKVAITGGSGFIGRWFLKMYGGKYECFVLGRKEKLQSLHVAEMEFQHKTTNFSHDQLVKQLEGTEAVVHLAAIRFQSEERMERYSQNIEISSALFEACKDLGIRNIINTSSISVYNSELELPWREDQHVYPPTFYGISKLTVEKIAHHYNWKHRMKIKSLRVAHVIGVGEREGFMLSLFLKKALSKETLHVWGKGEGRREYIYVKDVASAIQRALDHPQKAGVFNIGTQTNTSHKELAEMINEVFDNPDNIEFLADHPEDKNIHLMSIEKAKRILNWLPHWTLKEALYDMKNGLLKQHQDKL